MKRVWLILATFVGLMAAAAPASADIQYTLNCSNTPCTGSNATNNYGTVTLHQSGSGSTAYVTVTVTLQPGNVFLSTGAHSGFTFNLNTTPTSITITSANASSFNVLGFNGSYENAPFTTSGLSNFEFAIKNKNTGGEDGVAGPLVFDIKKTGGLVLTNSLFDGNSGGYFFATDIGQGCELISGKWKNCDSTGVVASNKRIPEPGTLGMTLTVVAGVMGLVTLQRRRKLARA